MSADPYAGFRADGHCVLRGALPCGAIAAAAGPIAARETGGARGADIAAARGASRLEAAPAAVRALVLSPALGRIAAEALGVPAVRLLSFGAFFKAVGATIPWHQDMSHLPLAEGGVVTLWMPLAPVDADMAPLIFAQKSHLDGAIPLEGLERRYRVVSNPPMAPGDVSLHHGWTAHRSAANTGSRTRAAFAAAYFADGVRLRTCPDATPAMAGLYAGAFAGLRGGDVAAGPGAPLVYRTGDTADLHEERPC